ncbi:MAG: LicD family protein [Bacilli bacterium]|nr:LicD family protein [Bacilli bacterium]
MKELRELQKIDLIILKEIDKICKKHNIRYYLGEGTLLGAIRHQGFIPWDDDIDILMPRKDYEKFLKIAPKSISKNYEIQHSTTVDNYWSPFIKVRYLKECFFKQQHIAHLTNHNGPLIDIFPLDNVPQKDSFKQKIQAMTIKLNRGMLSYKLKTRIPKKWKGYIVRFLSKFISVKRIHKNLDKTFKKYNNSKNKYIVNLASYYSYKKQTVPKEWYGKPRMVKFENLILPIPKESEKLLTSIYGDYMQLPPEEKRVIKHHF